MSKSAKNVYPEISQLKLRPLTNYDFREFKASVMESKESISTFLDIGLELPNLHTFYWVREQFLRQNIGTWIIGNMTNKSWVELDYHFAQMTIDKANYSSRKIARRMGFEPLDN